jgi:glutathione S-transferase
MYQLYGFSSQNTMKTLYVLEEIGVDYEFHYLDLFKGEHQNDEFRSKTPVGKVPLLEHDGQTLFESGAICRYVANVENSPLYPENKLERAQVDQWLDFFSNHLGRQLNDLFFERVLKARLGIGDADPKACEVAEKFANSHLGILEQWLSGKDWIANDRMSIADLADLAYLEQVRIVDFSLGNYPNVAAWFSRLDQLPSVKRARERLRAAEKLSHAGLSA